MAFFFFKPFISQLEPYSLKSGTSLQSFTLIYNQSVSLTHFSESFSLSPLDFFWIFWKLLKSLMRHPNNISAGDTIMGRRFFSNMYFAVTFIHFPFFENISCCSANQLVVYMLTSYCSMVSGFLRRMMINDVML